MKKKTIIALISFYIFSIALILFCVFLYINAKDRHPEENWITIASTENEDNTHLSIASSFIEEIDTSKNNYDYASVYYAIKDKKANFWKCTTKNDENKKSVVLHLQNAFIVVDFYSSLNWQKKISDKKEILPINIKLFNLTFCEWLLSTVDDCITESNITLKKYGQRHSGNELDAIRSLKFDCLSRLEDEMNKL